MLYEKVQVLTLKFIIIIKLRLFFFFFSVVFVSKEFLQLAKRKHRNK